MIYFSDFGVAGGPVGDVSIGVQSIASGTTNTTVSGTSTNLSGITPVAALVFSARHAIANDPGETPHAEFSIGILEGTNDYLIASRVEDNSASTDTDRVGSTSLVMRSSLATSVTLGRSATGVLASGGVDLTFAGSDTINRRVSYMAFGGPDCLAYSAVPSYTTSGITQTPAFGEPDVVFLLSVNLANAATTGSTSTYSFGIALADGTQMCVLGSEADNAAAGTPVQAILTNRAGGQLSSAGALDYDMTVAVSGGGYTVTPSATAGGDFFYHLALDLGGRRTKLLAFTTPTSTGDTPIPGAGFTPQAALIVLTNLEATDPTFSISTSDLMSGISFSMIADNAASHSVRSDSGADPTDTASQSREIALIGPSETDCDAITATLTSFDSDGMTLNYSAVQGTAKKGFILFIE